MMALAEIELMNALWYKKIMSFFKIMDKLIVKRG